MIMKLKKLLKLLNKMVEENPALLDCQVLVDDDASYSYNKISKPELVSVVENDYVFDYDDGELSEIAICIPSK